MKVLNQDSVCAKRVCDTHTGHSPPNRAINPKKTIISTLAPSNPGTIHQPLTKRGLRPLSPNSRLEISSSLRQETGARRWLALWSFAAFGSFGDIINFPSLLPFAGQKGNFRFILRAILFNNVQDHH
jgi:hypothetical protein